MKFLKFFLSIILGIQITTNAFATPTGLTFRVENEHAQAIFETLTGVQEEGSAGQSYKKGKSVLCWYINADINDAQGKPIPAKDPKRYACSMYFDSNGLVTPGNKF